MAVGVEAHRAHDGEPIGCGGLVGGVEFLATRQCLDPYDVYAAFDECIHLLGERGHRGFMVERPERNEEVAGGADTAGDGDRTIVLGDEIFEDRRGGQVQFGNAVLELVQSQSGRVPPKVLVRMMSLPASRNPL